VVSLLKVASSRHTVTHNFTASLQTDRETAPLLPAAADFTTLSCCCSMEVTQRYFYCIKSSRLRPFLKAAWPQGAPVQELTWAVSLYNQTIFIFLSAQWAAATAALFFNLSGAYFLKQMSTNETCDRCGNDAECMNRQRYPASNLKYFHSLSGENTAKRGTLCVLCAAN